MPGSINEFLGAASFPLLVSDVEATQSFPDPVKQTLLEMLVAATNYEFGNNAATPWRVIRQGTSLETKDPVNDSLPSRVDEQLLKERKGDFPFLFLGRLGKGEFGTDDQAGMQEDSVECDWVATWCLGPLHAGEKRRFEAALEVWFPNLVRMVTENRCHPAYNNGRIPFGPGGIPLGDLETISFDSAAVEIPVGDRKELYYGVDVLIRTIEYGGTNVEGTPFLGESHGIKVNGVPHILDLDTTHKG